MQIHQIGGFMNQKMKTAPAAENKMGTMPIGKLLFNMSLPMMISMLVQALYNIVDSIFVAKLSENALTAVSLAFPLQTLLIAVATGTGVGMNALLSKALGERRSDEADKIAVNTAFIYFLSYLVFLILGFTIVKPFYASQIGTADAEIMEMGIDYLRTVMIFSFGLISQIFFERLLTSTGRTIFSMTSQLCGAITNIILDPIMIFGLLGCPKMGVTGAAVATVIGLDENTEFDNLETRIKQVEYLAKKLDEYGIPYQRPAGGHAIFIDAPKVLTHVPREEFPAQTLTIELYLEAGIRGCEIGYILADRDPVTHENRFNGLDLLRLAIPRRVYTDNHMNVIAAALKNVYERRESITHGVRIAWEAPLMRHFTVQLERL